MSTVPHAFVPHDELPHPAGPDPRYSESVYFNFVADDGEIAGFMRIGNRVNTGHAEVTVLVYLPDGRAAFRYVRPAIAEPSFDLEGLTMQVVEPLARIRLTYEGDVHVLADGTALENPRAAFAENPAGPCSFDLDFRDVMPLIGWKANDPASVDPFAGGAWAPNHYEAVCRVSGEILLEGRPISVQASGLRDHSWGARDWVAPEYYRWVSCFTPSGEGWVVWLVHLEGSTRGWGFLRLDGQTHPVSDVEVTSEYDGEAHYPAVTTVSFTANGERHETRGERVHLVPLRHRRGDEVARLSEVVFRYEFRGEVGHGVAEFHDRIEDGRPAGMGRA